MPCKRALQGLLTLIIVIFVPPYTSLVSLVVFKVFSLSFVFNSLIIMCCHMVSLSILCLGFIELLRTVGL